jgi:hypothetical protein
VQPLEGITANPANPIRATFWDAVKIEQMLSTPRTWPIAQRFFPKSADSSGWRLHPTERPNHWLANYRGYYFHLSNRIGSWSEPHLGSISERIADVEKIALPKGHVIRPRAVYYDDKHGNYTWFLDYMVPCGEKPAYSPEQIKKTLGDGYALSDGQHYTFDVRLYEYLPHSDHHDFDHYRYYTPYIGTFLIGFPRED